MRLRLDSKEDIEDILDNIREYKSSMVDYVMESGYLIDEDYLELYRRLEYLEFELLGILYYLRDLN